MPEAGEGLATPLSAWPRIRADVGWVCRVGLTVGFSLATLALCFYLLNQEWDDSRALLALAVAAGLLGLLVLGTSMPWRRGQPVLLVRIERWRPRLLLAWGLVLAAAGATLVLQDQAKTKECEGYQTAWSRIHTSRELADRLGEPIRPGWWVSGDMEPLSKATSVRGWRLEFSVSGPKGTGKVRAQATRSGQALSESAVVTIAGTGEHLELVKPRPAQAAQKPAPAQSGGANAITSRLKTGMTYRQVREALGEPHPTTDSRFSAVYPVKNANGEPEGAVVIQFDDSGAEGDVYRFTVSTWSVVRGKKDVGAQEQGERPAE